MYLRMRKSMFLAFSDVIDAFVVAGKRLKKGLKKRLLWILPSKNKFLTWYKQLRFADI